MGVLAVAVSRYAVTTQESSFSPPRSLVIVGSAVDTIVWSSAASSIVSMRAPSAQYRWRVPDSSYVGSSPRDVGGGVDESVTDVPGSRRGDG